MIPFAAIEITRVGPNPRALIVHRPWPQTAEFLDSLVQLAHRSHGVMAFHYPYFVLTCLNGRAMYRLSTCDHGLWHGHLMESWFEPRAL